MSSSFVHLHCHSRYSFFNGTATPTELLRRAREWDMPALALTDFATLNGITDFCHAAHKVAVKPIVGYEARVAVRHRREKDTAADGLTLLAMNEQGWRNLSEMAARAVLEGNSRDPTIDKELLTQYHQGLICLSGFASGELARVLATDSEDRFILAKSVATQFFAIFGDRYYLELRNHGVVRQEKLFDETVEIGKELGIPTVATNDIHYMEPSEWQFHDALLCFKNGRRIAETDRPRMDSKLHYFRSAAEMFAAMPHHHDAVLRTVEIAERIEPNILGKV